MTEAWRVIVDEELDGVRNMAVDRSIQLCCEEGTAPPTLRLYRWRAPTVSLGRFQELESIDLEACAALGVDVVRRPTGGRGVLHDDEVTYAVVAGAPHGIPRGTGASYRHLCAGLVEAYRNLGIDASITPRARGERNTSACYLHTSKADLSLGSAKLAGSAQLWHGATCLQHGSLTRSRDIAREAQVFRLSHARASRLAVEAVTLQDALGECPSNERLVSVVVDGFSTALDVRFEPGLLERCELRTAERLEGEMRLAQEGRGVWTYGEG